MTDDSEWIEAGVLEVESGTCLIVDPTFHRDGFYDAERVGQAVLDAFGSDTLTAPPALSEGHEIGTVIRPGFGDDLYRVEVRYVSDERGTRRIAELRVRFIEGRNCHSGWPGHRGVRLAMRPARSSSSTVSGSSQQKTAA